MSEVDVLDPNLMGSVPVTKDPALVNGGDENEHDNIPTAPTSMEAVKEVNKPVNDINGEVNNINNTGALPVNGDLNGQDELETVSDTEGEVLGVSGDEDDTDKDELPPPPDMVGDYLPPPVEPEYSDSMDEEGTSVDVVRADNEEQEIHAEVDNNSCEVMDHIQRIMPDDVSEEDMVSDAGLRDEVEDMGHLLERYPGAPATGQLIDFGDPVDPVEHETQELAETIENEPQNIFETEQNEPIEDLSESPVPDDTVLVDTSEDGLVPEPVPEPCFEQEPVPFCEPAPLPIPVQEVEPYNAEQDVMMEHESTVMPEPVQERGPELEPVPEIHIEPEVEVAPEPDIDSEEEPVEESVIDQPQVGLAEPDLVIDTPVDPEPETEEVVPPPPPPPLVEEAPPPPPQPLDESIHLKRISGEVSPTSPTKSPEREMAAAVIPVVEPPSVSPTPVPEPPVEQPQPPVEEPVVGAPQADVESEVVSSPGSPPGSPTASSDTGTAELQDVAAPQVSQKINKKNFKNKIKFGVDLVEAALKQINFLNSVNKQPTLCEEWLVRKAIRRYEAFWLPMAAEHKKECLAAPIDIEWIWCCHLLAPKAYEADCKRSVGIVVEHKLYSEKDRTKGIEKSRKYWTTKFPKEPFEIDLVYKEAQTVEPAPHVDEEAPQNTDAEPANQEPVNQEEAVPGAESPGLNAEGEAEPGTSGQGAGEPERKEQEETTTDNEAQPKTE